MSEIPDPYVVMISALCRCSLLPGSWDKRFIGSMAQGMLDRNSNKTTEKQRATIIRLVHRYRRQIPVDTIMLAQDTAADVWFSAVREATP